MYTGPCDPQPPQSVIIGGDERSHTIIDLEEGANYTFGLTAINGIGMSRENMVTGYTIPSGLLKLIQLLLLCFNLIFTRLLKHGTPMILLWLIMCHDGNFS